MRREIVLTLIVAAGVTMMIGASSVRAQQQQQQQGRGAAAAAPPALNFQMEKVRNGIYQLPINAGATTTIFVTENNGVVLVDVKNPGSGQAILDKVKVLTDKPVSTIINTHTHNDHVGGNLAFPPAVEVVAQEATAGYMAKLNNFQAAENKYGLPDKTYKDKMTLFTGNDAVDLYFFGPAHTGGDTLVVFRNQRVMAAGDVFPATGTPIIDLDNGGSGLQWGQTIAKAAAGIRNVDVITRGHTSQTSDWAGFVEYGEYMTAYANYARTAKAAGKTIDQAVAEINLGPKFRDYFLGLSGRNPGTRANVTAMYTELDRPAAQ